MIKKLLLLFFVLSCTCVFSQVHKYWVGDTANVYCIYDSTNLFGDTGIYFRQYGKLKEGDTVVLYWDRDMKERRQTTIVGSKTENDTTFYRNGQVDELDYNMYQNNYSIAEWYPDGRKKSESVFKANERVDLFYFPDGHIKQKDISVKGIYKDTGFYEWAYTEEWCDNGTLIFSDSLLSKKVRHVIRKNCDGKVISESYKYLYYDVGPYKEWYPNGQLKVDGQYHEIVKGKWPRKLKLRKMQEQGLWRYYDESGQLIKTEKYKNGKLKSEIVE